MQEASDQRELRAPSLSEVADLFTLLAEREHPTPSHLYLEALRHALREGWSVADMNLKSATAALEAAGWTIEAKTGRLHRPGAA